jgi:hypothetical protein
VRGIHPGDGYLARESVRESGGIGARVICCIKEAAPSAHMLGSFSKEAPANAVMWRSVIRLDQEASLKRAAPYELPRYAAAAEPQWLASLAR